MSSNLFTVLPSMQFPAVTCMNVWELISPYIYLHFASFYACFYMLNGLWHVCHKPVLCCIEDDCKACGGAVQHGDYLLRALYLSSPVHLHTCSEATCLLLTGSRLSDIDETSGQYEPSSFIINHHIISRFALVQRLA